MVLEDVDRILSLPLLVLVTHIGTEYWDSLTLRLSKIGSRFEEYLVILTFSSRLSSYLMSKFWYPTGNSCKLERNITRK